MRIKGIANSESYLNPDPSPQSPLSEEEDNVQDREDDLDDKVEQAHGNSISAWSVRTPRIISLLLPLSQIAKLA